MPRDTRNIRKKPPSWKRQKEQEIKIANHQKRNKSSWQKIQCVANKNLISSKASRGLQNFYHYFPSKETTKGMKHHLSHNSTSSATSNPPTSIQINYSSRHNLTPKNIKQKVEDKLHFNLPSYHPCKTSPQWHTILSAFGSPKPDFPGGHLS